MSGPPRVRSVNFTESETRPVLGPAGNKARSMDLGKPISKPKFEKVVKPQESDEPEGKMSPAATETEQSSPVMGFKRKNKSAASVLGTRQPNLSLNASCSSDASSDSSHSRASTGRFSRQSITPTAPIRRKQQCSPKSEKVEKIFGVESEGTVMEGSVAKKRCAWVTPNTDQTYAAFHDEEWGVPVHDDKKLFELLCFSTALAELTWPAILNKRHIFREAFADFDPVVVSKLNEKKIASPGSPASSLLSELKLRSIIENARQICRIINELGSFEKYIWGFVNFKPVTGNFRYPRQVPIKTSKADTISKDLVKRGFRGVGPTVVYSFMQAAGITNDHLINCYRYQECIAEGGVMDRDDGLKEKIEGKQPEDIAEYELATAIDDLSLST
ncbi:DNA-3-methyladenine glycosylase I [Olea europaea subsp. europaea]|uniref:DNA-3-methyladenine glycosylase I n=1 Tax=Olea europaea subsp. europaea TaxID=158383 RepID=A0A8S0PGT8_OLEEU|nr:DNA-3-methyladenine glycosylase I [Olea europaea subsp. europaea]CAA2946596.1 DNA-3-methyladenine glycosylase I [Olea europaea subsp. europaea]